MTSRPLLDRAGVYFGSIAALFVLAIALRMPSLYEPRWYGDEGIFAAVAQNLRSGSTLYSDAWDNKPPLIFYTYAAIQQAFGAGVFALHLVTTLVVLATMAVVMIVAARLYGRAASLVAGLVFALTMCTPVIEGNLALTETFMILPASIAVLVFVLALGHSESERIPWLLGVGVLMGTAAAYKQVAVFDALALVVMIWLTHNRPLRATAAMALGFAVPQFALVLYFLVTGAFPDYWYAVAGSLPLYHELGPEQGPLIGLVAYVPALLVVAWLVHRRRAGERVDATHFAPLWLTFALIGATSSTFEFPHYLVQAAPAFALTIAGAPAIVPERREAMWPATAGLLAAMVCAAQFGRPIVDRGQLHPLAYYENYLAYSFGDRDHQQYERFFDGSAESVRDITGAIEEDGAGTSLYTWSELPWLYAAGGLENPARYYTSFLGELVPGAKDEVLSALEQEPPAYIVLTDTTYAPFDDLETWMRGRYILVRAQGDWQLYRLASLKGHLDHLTTKPNWPSTRHNARFTIRG